MRVKAWHSSPRANFRPTGACVLPCRSRAVVVGTGSDAIYGVDLSAEFRAMLGTPEDRATDAAHLASDPGRPLSSLAGDRGPLCVDGALSASIPPPPRGRDECGFSAVACAGRFLTVSEAETGIVRCIPLPRAYLA